MINEEGNPFGYRNSYLAIAGILLVVGVLVVAAFRERPKNEEFKLDVSAKKKPRSVNWSGTDYNTVKRRPYFWMAAVCVLLTGFILQGISGVYAAHMMDVGIDAAYIATVASVFSLTLTVSKVLVGEMYDRFGLRAVMLLCQLSTVIAFAVMAFLDSTAIGLVLAMLFAVLYAVALPLETLVIPLIVNDLFGAASYDKILGIMTAMNYAGYAFGSPVTNLCYDMFGSYKPVLLLFSGLMIPICIVFQYVIRSANKAPERSNVNNSV
jgi:MFS family permease